MINVINKVDIEALSKIRNNVINFMEKSAQKYDRIGATLLDIAPQDHAGAKQFFKKTQIQTLDIDPTSGATYIADLCNKNDSVINGGQFDFIVCTEVLEHTLNPFNAVNEIYRMLKPGGLAFISTPFNFRIHGPLPDCWRFSEHALKELFKEFEIVELSQLDSDRFLFPIQYTMIVSKVK